MTHADLRQRLGGYADGTLGDADADAVRVHLATGCPECLREVFTRPVGLPRPAIVVHRPLRGVIVAALGGAAAVAVAVTLALALRREPRARIDPRVDALAKDVERLRAEFDRVEASARRHLDDLDARTREAEARMAATPPTREAARSGPAPAGDPPAAPDEAPPAATTPPVSEHGMSAAAKGLDGGAPGWLAEILGSEGARVVPLGPGESVGGGTGFAVWSPSRKMVVVSASDLPVVGAEVFYRVRVTMSDRSTAWVGDVVASPRRQLVISVVLPATAGRVDRVDLYRDPPGTPVLTARLTP